MLLPHHTPSSTCVGCVGVLPPSSISSSQTVVMIHKQTDLDGGMHKTDTNRSQLIHHTPIFSSFVAVAPPPRAVWLVCVVAGGSATDLLYLHNDFLTIWTLSI